jgi:hypothetical protein
LSPTLWRLSASVAVAAAVPKFWLAVLRQWCSRPASASIFKLNLFSMASLYLKTAVTWFLLAVSIGLYMGAAQDFRLVHVHVHLNLLGWVSLALIGLTWASFKKLSSIRLAKIQFYLHNAGLVAFMGGIAFSQLGGVKPYAVIAVGSCIVGAAVLIFAWQIWRYKFSNRDG